MAWKKFPRENIALENFLQQNFHPTSMVSAKPECAVCLWSVCLAICMHWNGEQSGGDGGLIKLSSAQTTSFFCRHPLLEVRHHFANTVQPPLSVSSL